MRPGIRQTLDFLTGLVEAGAVLACLATVFGFLGRLHWTLDLFSHFRVQLCLALVLACGWMVYLKRWAFSALFLSFAVVNLLTFAYLFLPAPLRREPLVEERSFRAMLINVNSSTGDPARVVEAVAEEDPDLLVLQELSSRWREAVETVSDTRPHRKVVYREDNFGIGIFSRYPLSDAEVLDVAGATLPSVRVEMELAGRWIQVLATHPLPPVGAENTASRNRHLAAIPELLEPGLPGLVIGDLNTTPWNHAFRKLMEASGLRNAAKGFGLQPTWPAGTPLLWIPLDHMLVSEDLEVTGWRVGPDVGSDHYPVTADLRMR